LRQPTYLVLCPNFQSAIVTLASYTFNEVTEVKQKQPSRPHFRIEEELVENWTLLPQELQRVNKKVGAKPAFVELGAI
jgi:hypothetical protein